MAIYADSPIHCQGGTFAASGDSADITLYDNCHEVIITYIDGADGNVGDKEDTSIRVQLLRLLDGVTDTEFGIFNVFYGKTARWKVGPRSQRPGSAKFRVKRTDVTDTGSFRWNVTQILGVMV